MRLNFTSLLSRVLFLLLPLSITLTTYLYLYPIFRLCAFPSPDSTSASNSNTYLRTLSSHLPFRSHDVESIAPFRLLALGDPQIEGDTSFDVSAGTFPNFHAFFDDALRNTPSHNPLQRLRASLHDAIDFWLDDIPRALKSWRKQLDLWGNDYYLAHVARTMAWWTRPTHVSVLGDLLGSQWIDDEEFARRSGRFWSRVFPGSERLSDEVTEQREGEQRPIMTLGEDKNGWKKRLLNVAGNHDVGYAGDMTIERLERFENAFGRANYELRFQMPSATPPNLSSQYDGPRPVPELRIVVLNNMNLDTPAYSSSLQEETYAFLNHIIGTSQPVTQRGHFTLLLTHIPLHKFPGVCIDGPFFDFHSEPGEAGGFPHGVKEQNHLSAPASANILEGMFGMKGDPSVDGAGMGRKGLIVVGHDHEGCDVWHYINQTSPTSPDSPDEKPIWQAAKWNSAKTSNLPSEPSVPGIREITVRSMMGDFSGNAGLVSLSFDTAKWEWKANYASCELGRAYLWWIVHILDFITMGITVVYGALRIWDSVIGMALSPTKGITRTNTELDLSKLLRSKYNKDTTRILEIPGIVVSDSATPNQKKILRRKRSKQKLIGAANGDANWAANGSGTRDMRHGRPDLKAVFEIPGKSA
jgi:hypothetical protein